MAAYVLERNFFDGLKEAFCPFCGGSIFKKNGKRNSKQRYKCLSCQKIFLETTKTIFSSAELDKETLRRLIIVIIDDTKMEAIMKVCLYLAELPMCGE